MGNTDERLEGTRKVKVLVAQSCPTLCSPWTIAHQAPLSMGFSRQEYWNRMGHHVFLQGIFPTQKSNSHLLHLLHWQTGSLPLVPHIRECICMCVCVCVTQSCPILCDPMGCSPPGSSLHEILQARILDWVAISSPGDLPDPRKTGEEDGVFSPFVLCVGQFLQEWVSLPASVPLPLGQVHHVSRFSEDL